MAEIMTFEQAQFIASNENKAEVYEQQLQQVVKFFAKNTHFQLLEMEMSLEALELHSYYKDGDYSQFLFDKTEELLEAFGQMEEHHKDSAAAIQEVAKLMNEVYRKAHE